MNVLGVTLYSNPLCFTVLFYIYIYIYICVCVCVCINIVRFSITFIVRLMHSIIQNLEFKIYIV